MSVSSSQVGFSRLRGRWIKWLGGSVAMLALSFGLAWVSAGFRGVGSWWSFLGVSLAGSGILLAGWYTLKADRGLSIPGWLGWLLVGTALLRLAAGVFWFVALPAWGYSSPAEQSGYVMADAQVRDSAAWELSQTGSSLIEKLGKYRQADQYGGLLLFSALVYRYLGGGFHQPLMMVVLCVAISAMAVPFTWAFARRGWDDQVAHLSVWMLALFPEAVLLGSSQMREAFTMTLTVVTFYGLLRYRQERTWIGLGWMLGALIVCLLFSPPYAALLLGMLLIQALALYGWRILRQRKLWLVLGGLALAAGIGLWLSWGEIGLKGIDNPLMLPVWWIKRSASWQAYLTKHASDSFQRIFRNTPGWSHFFILLGYGVMQPFLPAALIADGVPLWRGIAVWRAVGWTVLLPLLLAGTLRTWGKRGIDSLARGLNLVLWWGILTASYRSGGDFHDNPRYRVAFVGLMVAFASWAWVEQRRRPDAWLRRAVVSLAMILLWFLPWYLGRYTALAWPVEDLFKTLGLGLASIALFFMWDWARNKL